MIAVCLKDHVSGPFRFVRGEYFTAENAKFADFPEPIPVILAESHFGPGWALRNCPADCWALLSSTRPSSFWQLGLGPDEVVDKTANASLV
jgi:hypothetical protein